MKLKSLKIILLTLVLVVSVGFSLKANADNGEYRVDFGINLGGGQDGMYEPTLTTASGWNNFIVSMATTTVLSLVDTNGASGTAQMFFSNVPDCQVGGAMSGDYSGPIVNSLGYPATVSRDFYYDGNWRCPAGDGKSAVTFTGLNPAYTYTIKVYGSSQSAVANITVTVGTTTAASANAVNNTGSVVQINNATTSATSSVTVSIGRQNLSEPYYVNAIELIANTGNAAPVVNAGTDSIVTATGLSTTITLSGTATDSDGTIATTTWEMYSGPGGTITSSSSLTTTVTGLYPGVYSFRLYATDNFGKKVMDEKIVTVRPSDYISTRPAKKIVAVGDSITFGWGSTPITTDAAVLNTNTWLKLYEAYIKMFNPASSVINYGNPGWTTTQSAATGTTNCIIPNTIVPGCTIGQAVAQAPDVILITSSTNDPALGVSTSTTVANIAFMVAYASSSGIPVWIETPTPRPGGTASQQWMRNYILTTYPTRSIDFFTPMADGSGNNIPSLFNSDTIHPNNIGYATLYKQVVASRLYEAMSSATSTAPAATTSFGNTQATVSWSYPSNDGGMPVTAYKVYNASTNLLASTTASTSLSATFTGLTNGTTYSYYVTAVTAVGESASSTAVSVVPAAVASAPLAPSGVATSNQITLSWSAPASNGGSSVLSYNIYNALTNAVVMTTSSTTFQAIITGLGGSTSYSYYVTAVTVAGESASSTVLSITTAASPVSALVYSGGYSGGSSSSGSSGIPSSLLPFISSPGTSAGQSAAGGVSTSITSGSFSRSLSAGMSGFDVKALQQYLNAKGFIVSVSGAGSKGKETNLFGPATRAAVIKFQKAMKITPAVGFFGPITRAAIK